MVSPLANNLFKLMAKMWHYLLVAFVGSNKDAIPPMAEHKEILCLSAIALAEKISKQELKSEDVVTTYIARIKEVNPIINAVVDERFQEAIIEAKRIDRYIEQNEKQFKDILQETPFIGVPISIKNSLCVKGMIQDVGFYPMRGLRADSDSEVVKCMRNAGAIPLVISNTPTLCQWGDSTNFVHGKTNNPYDLTKIPGGSSGGEGALIGSACSVVGIGTDGGGSIRFPAYCCGIFGHKPSKKLLSNEGCNIANPEIVNIGVTGPMCRYAEDLLPMLKVLSANNVHLLKLHQINVSDVKVYFLEEFSNENFIPTIHPEMKKSVEKVVEHLNTVCKTKAKGFQFEVNQKYHGTMMMTLVNSLPGIRDMPIGKDIARINPLSELFKWLFGFSKHCFNFVIYLLLTGKSTVPKEVYELNENRRDQLRNQLEKLLGDDGVLILPPQPDLHYYHQETIFKITAWCYAHIFNMLGFPVTQCPIGLNADGLPMGVQVAALTNNDHLTIAVAKELQSAFGGWKSPQKLDF